MADLKKFLDQAGVSTLWTKVAEKIEAEATRAKQAESANASVAAAAKSAADAAQATADVNTDNIKAINDNIGKTGDLQTTSKVLVTAINEVRNAVSAGGTAAAITLSSETTTDGMSKSYTLKQGNNTVGVIDIPKDMVVTSGEVVELIEDEVEGKAAGTYIKLVLANVEEPLYISAASLVDIYTAEADAAKVQLTISADNVISAVIVSGAVGADELAENAVTTVKIADGNVTKAKLSSEVQSSLDKADAAAPQTVVNGMETRLQAVEAELSGDGEGTVDERIAAAKSEAITSATGIAAADATTKANTAESNAKSYADSEINNKIIALTTADIEAAIGSTTTE